MTVNNKKSELRLYIHELNEKVSVSEKLIFSHTIFNKIENLEVFQQAITILLYWSMENEVRTHDFVRKWKGRKTILLPVFQNDGLKITQYTGKMNMVKTSKLTLFEPASSPLADPGDVDLVIAPGLAFDHNNNRLGHGKGYYDSLLAGMRAYKIGICFNFQLFNEISYT